jgi:hypothetical protein
MKIVTICYCCFVFMAITSAATAQRRKAYSWPVGGDCIDPKDDKFVELACLVQQQEYRMLHYANLGGNVGDDECDRLWQHHKLMHTYLEQFHKLFKFAAEWNDELEERMPPWWNRVDMRGPWELNRACRF